MSGTSVFTGWVITRPGFKNEPERVVTFVTGLTRNDAIVRLADDGRWQGFRKRGYRCEKCRITIDLAAAT